MESSKSSSSVNKTPCDSEITLYQVFERHNVVFVKDYVSFWESVFVSASTQLNDFRMD